MGVFEDLCNQHGNNENELEIKSYEKDDEKIEVSSELSEQEHNSKDNEDNAIYSSSNYEKSNVDLSSDNLEPKTIDSVNEELHEEKDKANCESPKDVAENINQEKNSEKEDNVRIELEALHSESNKISSELRELRKLYHNEFSGRLQSMQHELDGYHEMDKGRIYDGMLTEIARLYSENISVIDKVEDEKAKKQLRYMFMDVLQTLENYGVQKQESSIGDKRNTRFCQVIERLQTDDQTKHDTVAKSRSVGFFIENRVLVKEMIDVYIYANTNSEENN